MENQNNQLLKKEKEVEEIGTEILKKLRLDKEYILSEKELEFLNLTLND